MKVYIKTNKSNTFPYAVYWDNNRQYAVFENIDQAIRYCMRFPAGVKIINQTEKGEKQC